MKRPPLANNPERGASERIEAELMQALCAAQASEPIDAVLAQRIKHRVLTRIAQADDPHRTEPQGNEGWQRFAAGLRIKVLNEADGVMSYLLEFEAGAQLAAHRHPLDEECVVLQGSLRIGDTLELSAGAFHLARRDTLHAAITSDGGATIFLRGATPEIAHLI